MDNNNNNMDSFEASMQDMFSAMESTADAHVWQSIEATLQPNNSRALGWWWWNGAAASSVLFIMGFGLFEIENVYSPRSGMFATSVDVYMDSCSVQDNSLNSIPIQSERYDRLVAEGKELQEHVPNRDNESGGDTMVLPSDMAITEELIEEYRNEIGIDSLAANNREKSLKSMQLASIGLKWDTTNITNRVEGVIKVFDGEVDWQEWDDNNVSNWSMAANLGSSGSNEQTGNAFGSQSEGSETQDNIVTLGLSDQRTTQKLTYLSPFAMGLRGNWQFAKRLSIETGLSYSILPSSSESYNGGVKLVNRYSDHFIGLPVLLNLSIIDRKRFGLYTSQGLLIEKGIYSRNKLTTIIGTSTQSEQITKLETQGTQLGATFGVGAEYRVTKFWGIFFEPRVTSWLVNVNVQENIRNQQVVWPTLDLGVRLNLN